MQRVRDIGGQAFLVGGAVRDFLLQKNIPKDLDFEIFGIEISKLEELLLKTGKLSKVGKSFGVLKLTMDNREYDFSLPREEWKTEPGHTGFVVKTHTNIAYQIAALRRDFTINSIAYDPLHHQILDPFHGTRDLEKKILRHIGSSFSEDPLRVLRAMQFSARFEFRVAPETIRLCQKIHLHELPRERIFEEFRKLLLLSEKPSIGLEAAYKLGILDYFPEIKIMLGVPQDSLWYPEGDVWSHTLRTLDAASTLKTGEDSKDLELMLAALCHDFGKGSTTSYSKKKWHRHSHNKIGITRTRIFLERLTHELNLIEQVQKLVHDHLSPIQLYNDRAQVDNTTIRKLALRVSIKDLIRLAQADYLGRINLSSKKKDFPAGEWLMEEATKLSVHERPPQPFLKGRHLIELGLKQGPSIGPLLKKAFDAQIKGQITSLSDALLWAKHMVHQEFNLGGKNCINSKRETTDQT